MLHSLNLFLTALIEYLIAVGWWAKSSIIMIEESSYFNSSRLFIPLKYFNAFIESSTETPFKLVAAIAANIFFVL